jgi:hypothetical protein
MRPLIVTFDVLLLKLAVFLKSKLSLNHSK